MTTRELLLRALEDALRDERWFLAYLIEMAVQQAHDEEHQHYRPRLVDREDFRGVE
ncbi:hypothetical protein [Mesorhizobium australicum]|nr:hypothetical protein [Mesorhizobium australicum]